MSRMRIGSHRRNFNYEVCVVCGWSSSKLLSAEVERERAADVSCKGVLLLLLLLLPWLVLLTVCVAETTTRRASCVN